MIVAILVSVSILLNVYLEYNETGQVDTNKISEAINTVVDEINKSSTEIPNLTETDEQSLEVQETESEGFEEQGIIAYEGSEKTPSVEIGEYAGLTYYSQLDNRWSSKMYSSIENKSQTIGSSGCGPTSSAMVVSSIKGNITPDTMAELYTRYGYRSANQGTYWSAFKWTADIFDMEYSECYKLDDAVEKLKDNYYIIASCNQGLFTYGGHFIVLIGIEGDYIKVYDPYLYNGKFDVSSRRGLATVKGIILPQRAANSTHVFHQYTIRVQNHLRDELKSFLAEHDVPSMIYYPIPLHLQEAYAKKGQGQGTFPVAEQLSEEVLSLPMHTELKVEEQEYIIEQIRTFFNR